jgi:hypothetical protein
MPFTFNVDSLSRGKVHAKIVWKHLRIRSKLSSMNAQVTEETHAECGLDAH